MKLVSAFFCLVFATAASGYAQDRIVGQPFSKRSVVVARNGMACTSQPLASQVAIDVLQRGGTAVDAAIAANAALGLMEPTGNGIGGDLFAIVWSAKEQKLYGLNGSGRSPKGLTYDTLMAVLQRMGRTTLPPTGPLPVSVPGAVDAWFELHGKFGRLPMKDVLAPAIRYAREGFPVSQIIAFYWARNAQSLSRYPNVAEVYIPNGKPVQEGEVFRNPALANTLEQIAKGGRDAFYRGDIARTIAQFIQDQGGYLRYEDLASHRSEWVQPVSTDYRGYTVWELPPNGQGIAALQMFNILEGYDIRSMGFGSAEWIHTFVEAKKLAFEDRAKYYADPAFNQAPVDALLSKAYAAERRKLISARAARRVEAGDPAALQNGDTIYMTVADGEGNIVSLIQSNYRGMGSGMVPPGLGFMLQDRGELFSLVPGHANQYAPGKRPFHTIIPAFVTKDGKPYLSYGVMGGGFQPLGHVQVLVNHLDFGMNLQEAGDAPRIDHQGSTEPDGQNTPMTDGGVVLLESGYSDATLRELQLRGHRLGRDLSAYGGYQAIGVRWDADGKPTYFGATESRKDGAAIGY